MDYQKIQIVTDNGAVFVVEEFQAFMSRQVIKQITTSLKHSPPNRLAESCVRIFKEGMKKNE